MTDFEITIRATVTKTYTVQASDSDDAVQTAVEMFSVLNDGTDEHYQQEVLDITELKGKS